MKRIKVTRKLPTERKAEHMSNLQIVRLHALVAQSRAILRPVAHRELRAFIGTMTSAKEMGQLLEWGAKVMEADFHERYSLTRPRTKLTVRDCPLPVFSQPDRAFKVRWMYRPRNLRRLARTFVDFVTMRDRTRGPPRSGGSPGPSEGPTAPVRDWLQP